MTPEPRHFSEAVTALRCARRLVIFTGAGISAESGIPTFRDGDGLWQRFPPDRFATARGLALEGLMRPGRLAEFLQVVLNPIAIAEPNPAHEAIAHLERTASTTVITQNVDGLHQLAGSSTVLEIHGSFLRTVGWPRRRSRMLRRSALQQITSRIDSSRHGPFKLIRLAWALRPWLGIGNRGFHRPQVVLFGESLAEPDWSRARAEVGNCDTLLTIGTSGEVFPAALVPSMARQNGATVITIDPNTPGPSHIWLRGSACDILPPLVREVTRIV